MDLPLFVGGGQKSIVGASVVSDPVSFTDKGPAVCELHLRVGFMNSYWGMLE